MPQDQGGGNRCGCQSGERHLTDREIEVLLLVAAGKHNNEIAHVLGISTRTVDHHLRAMLRRAQAASRAELIARCYAARVIIQRTWPPARSGRNCLREGPWAEPAETGHADDGQPDSGS